MDKITMTDGINEDTPIFFANEGDIWASGKNERLAQRALRRKIFASKTEDQRIEEFVEKYPLDALHTTDEWVEAHRDLTGACGRGGLLFIKKMGFKRYAKYTTEFFLNAVDGAYGGDIIKKVKTKYGLAD